MYQSIKCIKVSKYQMKESIRNKKDKEDFSENA